MSEKIRKTLWHLSKGEFPPVWRLLPAKYRPERLETNYLDTVDGSSKLPSYVDSEFGVSYDESANAGRSHSKYYPAITGETGELHLEVNPECQMRGCFFHLINADNYDIVSVSITGSNSHSSVTKNPSFTAGDSMHIDSHPVSVTFDDPVDVISIDVTGSGYQPDKYLDINSSLSISTPSVRKAEMDNTPIFLISIDTFRHDYLHLFDDLRDLLGETFTPKEPRTQGRYTRPSHGSMITGTHPGTHGYCTGFGRQIDAGVPLTSISPGLRTLPESLTESGYTCGACTSWKTVGPEYGFGRGFQEFRLENRDWDKYQRNSDTVVNRAVEWVEQMLSIDNHDIFYFMHMFDAHLPYLSFSMLEEDEGIDVEITDRYMKDYINAQPLEYDELIEYADTTEPPSYIDELQTYYKKSLTSVSRSLERFVSTLDNHDILDESLIIVVGDHGEEFLEAGIAGHATLYNRNICPGMLVKPPVDADFFVPDEADLIDIYPTISDYVSGDIPNQCAGDSWLRMEPNNTSPRIRVTEAFTGISTYAISVEDRGVKGIFTFDSDIPSRPTLSQLDAGPETKEFIIDTDSMSGNTESSKQELENTAREFVKSRSDKYQRGEEIKLSSEAVERLEELGYK